MARFYYSQHCFHDCDHAAGLDYSFHLAGSGQWRYYAQDLGGVFHRGAARILSETIGA